MKNASEPNQSIQRVKVGMTGLALVLLLIGLASAIFSSASREPPVAAVGAAQPDTVANLAMTDAANAAAAKEPLAELGVAPSTAPEAENELAPAKPVPGPAGIGQ